MANEKELANGFVLGAGRAVEGLDISLDLGGGADQPGGGVEQEGVSGVTGGSEGGGGVNNVGVGGAQLVVHGHQRADLKLLLVGGVGWYGAEHLDKLLEVIETHNEAHLGGGDLGNGFALRFEDLYLLVAELTGGPSALQLADVG